MSASAPRFATREILVSLVALCAWMAVGPAAPAVAQQPDVGLSAVRAQRFGRPQLPNANPDGHDLFGYAFAVGDFDGDGVDDLATAAIGSNGLVASPVEDCGQVVVRYGVAGRGLDAASAPTVLGQFLAGSTNAAEPLDYFGLALAACDLNGDGFDDLAVGVPGEDLVVANNFEFPDAGVVEVYRGSSGGLVLPAAMRIRDLTETILAVEGAFFGAAIGCGDFDADGFDDLAVGLPGRIVGSAENAGRVNVFRGSASPILANPYVLEQVSLGHGGVEAGDRFGSSVEAGDFNGDGFVDLAVSVPGETHEVLPKAAVHVYFGGLGELGVAGAEHVFNGSNGLDLTYGRALASGDFDADGFADLAIGVPRADSFAIDAGLVQVYAGSEEGIAPGVPAQLTPHSILGPGASQPGELFGSSLAVGDFDGDGADDLAVGSPAEELIAGRPNGAVTVAMGVTGVGLVSSPSRARQINSGTEGFPGNTTESVVRFGAAAAAGDFDSDGHLDLAVGAPDEFELGLPGVGTATVLFGSLFADGVGSGSPTYWSVAVPGP